MLTPTPQLPGHWLKGSIDDRRNDPLGFFGRLRELGPVSRARLFWLHVYALNSPEAIKRVFVDNAANYWKGRAVIFLKDLLGNGLLTAEGEGWLRNRRLAQPAFHRERLAGWVELMASATAALFDRWDAQLEAGGSEVRDVLPDLMTLTMSIVGRTLFSADVTSDAREVGQALAVAIEETNRRVLTFNPLVLVLPTANKRRFDRAKRTLQEVVLKLIAARHRAPEGGRDLLAMLMDARDADTGERMSDQQLLDEVLTLFLAGHETTAVGLSWLWYALADNPEAAAWAREEVDAVLGARAPTAADLPRLPRTLALVEEGLRLYPPAWIIGREAYEEDEVQGHRIPKRTILVAVPYALHRDPRYWPEPDRFDPTRFLADKTTGARPRHAYLPFGAGQRMCIGNSFALMEMQVITAMVLQRFSFGPRVRTVEAQPMVTLRPSGGMPLAVRRREPRAPA